ncbi:hypothetical protein BFS06_09435 [Clostridium perfringens]|uniref:FRG domain-containing protein n=1 Tax=Clostridium perfringens TaxID=1502 RepID=UPI00103D57AF|nr:FRG domain-containing protein [Clostridium perfringens]TBX15614.1 hypothetical protein BFS06_09435 [Clostridium perfringens]
MKVFEINSLNEYIELIKSNKLNEYYFRGENNKYDSIISSLLRKDESKLLKRKNFNFYENVINKYYEEIATNISEFDRNNFLAFSQHHGLPTNLIDLTSSPLISLYFACSKDAYKKNDKGYVYLISKERTIDSSRLINELFTPPKENYNLISLFTMQNKLVFNWFVSCLNNYFWHNGFEPYLQDILKQCTELSSTSVNNILNFFNDYMNAMQDFKLVTNPELFNELLFENSKIDLEVGQCTNFTGVYINLISEFFSALNSIHFFNNTGLDIKFPNMPYFIYKTPYKFDRVRNQEGLFLYQLYYTYASECEGIPNKIIKQTVTPDLAIIINNQKHILEELDFIGINEKSIYGDFDSIAKYISQKFFN